MNQDKCPTAIPQKEQKLLFTEFAKPKSDHQKSEQEKTAKFQSNEESNLGFDPSTFNPKLLQITKVDKKDEKNWVSQRVHLEEILALYTSTEWLSIIQSQLSKT